MSISSEATLSLLSSNSIRNVEIDAVADYGTTEETTITSGTEID